MQPVYSIEIEKQMQEVLGAFPKYDITKTRYLRGL
jgi:hypothetical protein